MADTKISDLGTASALAGTEVLPVVQSGSTVKTAVTTLLKAAPAGTAAAPAFSWAGDTNTGLYSDTADTIQLSTGGTLRATVNSAGLTVPGQLAIGTASSESYGLKVVNSSDHAAYFVSTISNVSNVDGVLVETDTVATANGTYDLYGFSSQTTEQQITAGVTDLGGRTAITGDAYAATAATAGTLTWQIGVRGRAGLASGVAATAVVTSAYGGYFHIRNEKAGATITNAYGVYINNNETTGTITNRWDLYASSATAKSYFAGKVGIGTSPNYKVDIATSTNNDRALNITHTGAASANVGVYLDVTGAGTNWAIYAVAGQSYLAGTVGIGTNSQFGGGVGVVGLANAGTAPTTNPTNGGVLYAEGGALKWRSSAGTVTTVAPV